AALTREALTFRVLTIVDIACSLFSRAHPYFG
ncbi:MAG: hypothetical protein RL771_803, partial [Actinomycetota bacterium]